MKQNKVIYIISLVDNSVLFRRTLQMLRGKGYDVTVLLLHYKSTVFEQQLLSDGFRLLRIHYKSKINFPGAVMKLRRILRKETKSIIHTHLFEAGLAGMIAAKMAGVRRRIHTRHDAMIHHDYHPGAVRYDRMTNNRATEIIAITDNVKLILTEKENVPAEKIHVVHHGFDLNDFTDVPTSDKEAFDAKYPAMAGSSLVVGVISRWIEWKGIQYTIAAFSKLRQNLPDAHLVLANARGPYEAEIRHQLKSLSSESYTLIDYEPKIAALYNSFHVFVHVPVDELSEAFGQVYIEAMAAGIPSVITRSGIACDYAKDGMNCLVVPHRSSDAIYEAIRKLHNDPELCKKIRANGLQLVREEFTLGKMVDRLAAIYDHDPFASAVENVIANFDAKFPADFSAPVPPATFKFSVVIPTFNRAAHLKKAIESVRTQKYTNWEIVVVDDGSTDDTESTVKSFADDRIRYVRQENRERGAARNNGTAHASGEVITFLDSDDGFLADHLSVAAMNFQRKPEIKVFCTSYEIRKSRGTQNVIHRGEMNDSLVAGNPLSCHGVFLHRAVAEEFRFVEDRTLSGLEDWELWLKIAAHYRIHSTERITCYMNDHDSRSVLNSTPEKLETRFGLFIQLVQQNKAVMQLIGSRYNVFLASCYSYIALHLALTKKFRKRARFWLNKSIKIRPGIIFTRRFAAIIKHFA